MNKICRTLVLALIFTIIFNIPIFYLKAEISDIGVSAFLLDMLIVLPTIAILFYILTFLPCIGNIILSLCFVIGCISNFFIFTFRKSFDSGVLSDILSVEPDLTAEYVNIYYVFAVILLFLSIYYLICKLVTYPLLARESRVSLKYSLLYFALLIALVACASRAFDRQILGNTLSNYFPFNFIYNIKEYNKNYHNQSKLVQNKRDLTDEYEFKIKSDNQEPLLIVLIIGESMRGDLISSENMPLLFGRKNFVNFLNAKGSATSTKISIPYMLTSAIPPDFSQALSQKSVISIFKHLGFKTSWIGNQGIFGVHETTFASIALEADEMILKKDLRKAFTRDRMLDEHLIPFFDKSISEHSGNHLIVLHLLGSHWRFDQRIPENFEGKRLPECITTNCSSEEVLNSYLNSFSYTDQIINKVLTRLEEKNALVLYASDHGFSLGENGYFGNAYEGSNPPKEQLNIAMFVWGSDSFIKNNPSKYLNIKKHVHLPLSHDYIFHSMLDCINVKSGYIDKNLSLCK